MSEMPDSVFVRKVTNKTLSAVRPESPIVCECHANKLKRTKYIRHDIHDSKITNLRNALDCAQWLLSQSQIPEKHKDLLIVIDDALNNTCNKK